ncbi:MAG: SGNH/GDSL hydrolase family protein [Thermomicrobiales bacterium]
MNTYCSAQHEHSWRRRFARWRGGWLLALLVMLTACGGTPATQPVATAPPAPAEQAALVPTATAPPKPTLPPSPTATRTPRPTSTPSPTATPAAPLSATGSYLALGDSYAYGTGASDPATDGYAGRFAAALKEANGQPPAIRNLAVPGATSADFVGDYATRGQEGTSQLATAVRTLAAGDVGVVTLDIGGNDVLRLLKAGGTCAGRATLTAACQEAVRQSLQTLTEPNLPLIVNALVEAAQPGTQILVLTYPNPFSVGRSKTLEEPTNQVMRELNTRIAGAVQNATPAATSRSVTLTTVDLAPLFAGQGGQLTHILDSPPDIHPNDAGYAVIAEAIQRAYRPR